MNPAVTRRRAGGVYLVPGPRAGFWRTDEIFTVIGGQTVGIPDPLRRGGGAFTPVALAPG